MRIRHLIGAATLVAMVTACGDDSTKNGNQDDVRVDDRDTAPGDVNTGDAGTDANVADDVGLDQSNNGPPPDGCSTPLTLDTTFTLDSVSDTGQFYSRAVFDGESVWVVYNRPASESEFGSDMMVVRVGCDGSTLLGPLRLSDPAADGTQNYQPAIAAGDGNIYITWVSQPQGLNPKAILYRGFKRDGSPIAATAVDVTPVGGADPISETVWELDLAAAPNGEAVFAGSSGDFGTRQVVAQRFSADGSRIGDPMFPYLNKELNQTRPSVAVAPDGTIYLAWTQDRGEDMATGTPAQPELAVFTTIPPGATTADPTPPPPARPLIDPNPISSLSKQLGPNSEVFLAFQETSSRVSDIHVRVASDFSTTQMTTFGTPLYNNFRPTVVGTESGGALGWYRYERSPISAEVIVQGFAFDDGVYTLGNPVIVPMEQPGIPPYGPGVTHVGGDVVFLSWSEGSDAPSTRVKGRFVGL